MRETETSPVVFRKILIANRGEIACRIMRSCRRLGIATVAVYSDADASARHVHEADEAIRVGPPPVRESYLLVERLTQAAVGSGAQAVHPGYGFLSESPELARSVLAAGLVFIGPPPEALEAFGDKLKARQLATRVGVSPPPGSEGAVDISDVSSVARHVENIGYPLLVKAVAGGGGIGMQMVSDGGALQRALRACSDRASNAFGDGRVYLERYLQSPRHIEVQILCDAHGASMALGERECSVQRRHQKIIEESPSPAALLSGADGEARRNELFDRALRVVRAAGYVNVGTVEFVADASGALYFLEVNARLQVEHPVTEAVTGLDLVEMQLRISAGEHLPNRQVARRGHAIEARIYAEDPGRNFLPQPGRVVQLSWPAIEGVRIDAGVDQGGEITAYYDPMIAKMIAFGTDRRQAIERLDQALSETQLELVGPKGRAMTNIAYLRDVIESEPFQSGQYDTGLVEQLKK